MHRFPLPLLAVLLATGLMPTTTDAAQGKSGKGTA
jgi:hypothetical protein